ncbi:MAG: class II glutamine amidotransferase [Sulfuricaulis sp.]|uniref:class II glutamine amidotransferase n=1 Tax=Sulfuricaulis sp. TaxID=2003553 RepID=UPI0025E50D08|nr:class II glutamine amidotransferase [Sulfuricaulis sp.]MCR4347779.1 class II glutamine amidotransferase [Sulfuricaulis sp.]
MCELFGLSSNRPVQAEELLCRFGARGGDTADNPDGWGLATLDDGAFRLTKEPIAAARSTRFQQLCGQTHSSLILGHVRKANPPTALVLANTHPFRRACCGREWVFAHNGILPDTVGLVLPNTLHLCAPSGDTDSEHAFCVVLDRIAAAFSSSDATQGHDWLDALARAAEMLASHGRFNFLMSDGVHLIAYGHDRLHSLADARATFRLDAATETVVIATEPLTEGPGWIAFEPGELRVYRAGQQIAQFITHPRAMESGEDALRIKSIVSDTGRPAPLKNGGPP